MNGISDDQMDYALNKASEELLKNLHFETKILFIITSLVSIGMI
jgi:hypothetical protein